jgi:hypothetical protein
VAVMINARTNGSQGVDGIQIMFSTIIYGSLGVAVVPEFFFIEPFAGMEDGIGPDKISYGGFGDECFAPLAEDPQLLYVV